jgi:hypothetical protein
MELPWIEAKQENIPDNVDDFYIVRTETSYNWNILKSKLHIDKNGHKRFLVNNQTVTHFMVYVTP